MITQLSLPDKMNNLAGFLNAQHCMSLQWQFVLVRNVKGMKLLLGAICSRTNAVDGQSDEWVGGIVEGII